MSVPCRSRSASPPISSSPRSSRRRPRSSGDLFRPDRSVLLADPNGWKVSIMLEECGLPYRVRPIHPRRASSSRPNFSPSLPNNRMPAIVDPGGPDGTPISVFESGWSAISRPQDRQVLSRRGAPPRRRGGVALLAGRQSRADGGPGASFPPARIRPDSVRRRPLY